MESEQLWLSVGLGVAIGFGYVAASYLSNKRAMRSGRNFMLLVVSTMILRMFIALILLIGVMLTLPVSDSAFLGSFFMIFAIGLVAEIWALHRRQQMDCTTAGPEDFSRTPDKK